MILRCVNARHIVEIVCRIESKLPQKSSKLHGRLELRPTPEAEAHENIERDGLFDFAGAAQAVESRIGRVNARMVLDDVGVLGVEIPELFDVVGRRGTGEFLCLAGRAAKTQCGRQESWAEVGHAWLSVVRLG